MAGMISPSFVDNLLERLDLSDVISSKVKLKKKGANSYEGLCPFHNEKTPSFKVNTKDNYYHCFGCKAGGNAIKFIMEYDGLDFIAAVEYLAGTIGMEVEYQKVDAKQQQIQSSNKQIYEALADAAQIYEDALKKHDARGLAVNYLKRRNFSGQIAKHFGLGFAPSARGFVFQQLREKHGQEILLKAGLIGLKENGDVYDRFFGRIMFPIRDKRGRVTGFGGRIIEQNKDKEYAKYLNSPETDVFHKSKQLYGLYEMHQTMRQKRQKINEIIVVEGYLDVVALAQQEIFNVVATLGTAISAEQINMLMREVSTIIFCFDGDEAGRKAAWNATQIALTQLQDGWQVKLVFLPEGSDPDSLVNELGADKFTAYLKQQAVSLSNYLFTHLSQDLDDSPEAKAGIRKQALELIDQVKGQNLRLLLRQRLDEITGIPSNTNYRQSPAVVSFREAKTINTGKKGNKTSNALKYHQINSKKALGLLLIHPPLALNVDISKLEALNDDSELLIRIIEYIQQNQNVSSVQIMAKFHGSQQGKSLQRLAETGEYPLNDEQAIAEEFSGLIVKILNCQKKISILQGRINFADLSKKEQELLKFKQRNKPTEQLLEHK